VPSRHRFRIYRAVVRRWLPRGRLGDQTVVVERGSKGFETIRYRSRDEDTERRLDFERSVGAKRIVFDP
jgi:hypothetical protein